ncbi:MAG TPA: hypothetical protein VE981_10790, partial [Planctomycetota bacterium]|nr:hypothetical protein [Planctomycetota bacterium]
GETEAARTILVAEKSALPERFWLYAAEISHGPTEPSREQYLEALASLSKPATSADGVARLQLLLKDRAGDLFVRRNRAAITTRSQGGRDFVWFAEDLKSSGVFHLAKGSKLESCWTNESDVEGPKAKENFLEVEFSTLPDIPYKAWALIGGCCQEVLEFSCQGTEMEAGKGAKESAEPGSAAAVPVKPWMSSLKKTHSQHNGPKAPARWDWTPLPLPRYTRTGLQRLRLLSDQKGFSVAAVVVSAARTAPPSDAELRDLLRLRGDRPKAPPPPKAVVLAACKFDGSDRFLVGELKDKALHGVPLFGQLFTGYEGLQLVTMTENGEIRFTYFVKSPTKLTVRIRVERDGGTIPCDLPVPNVVVGTPTEVRIRFTDFKPAYTPGPNIAPGETAHMFHIFAAATDSALRIDAFSLVEIRK